MKFNKIILSVVACTLTLSSCDDNKMEWGTPSDHGNANISDIPLALKEKLANYDYIKAYALQYTPNITIGLGVGADLYINDPAYKAIADANFQMFTAGNAMKHSSVVRNNGDMDFTTIDAFLNAVPADMKIYGHNFIWHTQQRQAYLKSLIAPEVIVETSGNDVCENIISNYGFEVNADGWNSWSHHTKEIVNPGYKSDGALKLTVDNSSTANYNDQMFWAFNDVLTVGETYAFQFWAKTETPGAKVQFVIQSLTGSPQDFGETFELSSSWVQYTGEYTIPADKDNLQRIGIQFGGMEATIYIDDFKFGKKINDPDANRPNLLANGSFNSDISTWSKWNGPDDCNTWNDNEGKKAKGCLQIVNTFDEPSNQWKLQIHSDFTTPIAAGSQVYVSYYAKTLNGTGSIRCSTSGSAHYQGDQPVTSDWQRIEWEFTAASDVEGLNFDMAAIANTYLIDDVIVSTTAFNSSATQALQASTKAGGGITYKLKTPEEKKEILLGAMEEWIKGMLTHTGMERVKEWDVINEPIADGNNGWRGIDNVFGVTDNEGVSDMAPVETEESGLSLNWADEHFYWGYYIGKEYAVKAFEYARKYAPADAKLYVNDYNLETSPTKLAALIDFVKYIEDHGQKVDGIGTQMHVSTGITREQIDAMFKTMAATGKLVRVTELDVQVGTSSPSAEQLETQANVYQMIFESYKANVPEAQQSGITIWTLSDNAKEHEFWLNGDAPNLFDGNYERKHAYKGVCDGIAGRDISKDFNGDDWKNAYPTEEEETPAE